ncbi:MAG: hypothetical protein H6577_22080 [Lewinellaceae bacterium]|nr:hypothetical protein [Saprospiraceae bacterium]MCB9340823.1 hypothetical protein [Lewinellaceae bacterium]
MQSFEQEIKAFFKKNNLEYKDNSSSFKRLDFSVQLDEQWKFHFDAKEKRQHYNLSNWHLSKDQEPHTFIMDDLAARKILAYAPYSGMVVRDNLLGGYYFFSVIDLFLMPKTRVNRPIHKEQEGLKGKWIIDLRNGRKCATMLEVLALFRRFIEKREDIFINILECFGNYQGENIGQRGEVRRPEYWDIDVKETR